MTDDDWVEAAMADDSIVGHLLLHLNHKLLTPPPLPIHNTPTQSLPLDWSVRQRRSRTMILSVKKPISTRASPTTPLSWSGATSGSGGGSGGATGGISTIDGFEESSRPPIKRCTSFSRSKVIGTSEATSSKRPRKKKTLVELKVEEDLLLKERKYLYKKVESMRVTLEKQRTENESLKRFKLDLSLQSEGKIIASVGPISDKKTPENTRQSDVPLLVEGRKEVVDEGGGGFVLPDLNVAIIEEEFS